MNSVLTSFILCLMIVFIVFTILPIETSAISPSAITVNLAPQNPSAGENTTITLDSFSNNLDSILISWFVNGKKVSSGIGLKSFSLIAPSAGSETTVRSVLAFADGDIEKKIIIRPSVMVLLWEAIDSYVPPFYKGKALPTADSEIRVVAMPEVKSKGAVVSPKNMLYSWRKNYTNEPLASGYGKNSFTFINDYLENGDNIAVTASTLDEQYSSQASVGITVYQPQISFYKNDLTLGTIWEKALANGHRIVGDQTIVAEPYFMSPKEIWSQSLVWNWFINGNLTNNVSEYRKNWLPLRVEGGVQGTANLILQVENKNQLLGNAVREINVEF